MKTLTALLLATCLGLVACKPPEEQAREKALESQADNLEAQAKATQDAADAAAKNVKDAADTQAKALEKEADNVREQK